MFKNENEDLDGYKEKYHHSSNYCNIVKYKHNLNPLIVQKVCTIIYTFINRTLFQIDSLSRIPYFDIYITNFNNYITNCLDPEFYDYNDYGNSFTTWCRNIYLTELAIDRIIQNIISEHYQDIDGYVDNRENREKNYMLSNRQIDKPLYREDSNNNNNNNNSNNNSTELIIITDENIVSCSDKCILRKASRFTDRKKKI